MEADDQRVSYKALPDAQFASEGHVLHIKEKYWLVHPIMGIIFFKGSPVFCFSENQARNWQRLLFPFAEVRYLASVFLKCE